MVLPAVAATTRKAANAPDPAAASPDRGLYEAGKGHILSHFAGIATPVDNNNNNRSDTQRGAAARATNAPRQRARRSLEGMNSDVPTAFGSAATADSDVHMASSDTAFAAGATDRDMEDALFGARSGDNNNNNNSERTQTDKLGQWRRDSERRAPAHATANARHNVLQQAPKRSKAAHSTAKPLSPTNQTAESEPPAASLMFAMDFSPPPRRRATLEVDAAAAAAAAATAALQSSRDKSLVVLTLVLGAPLVLVWLQRNASSAASAGSGGSASATSAFSASFVSGGEPFSPAVSHEFLSRDLDEEEQALRTKSDKDRAYLYKKRYSDTYGYAVLLGRRVVRLEKVRAERNAEVDALRAKVRTQEQLIATLRDHESTSARASNSASQETQIQSLCREVSALVEQLGERDSLIQTLHNERNASAAATSPAERPSDTRVAELEGVIDALHDQIAAIRAGAEQLADANTALEDQLAAMRLKVEDSQHLYEAAETQRAALSTGLQRAQEQLGVLHAQWTREKTELLASATADERTAVAVAAERDRLRAANAALETACANSAERERALTAQVAAQVAAADEQRVYTAQLERELQAAHDRIALLTEREARLVAVEAELASSQRALRSATARATALEQELQTAQDELHAAETRFHDKSVAMEKRLFQAEIVRRSLHNKVMELKGNIRVFCRVRPVLPHEARASESEEIFAFPDYAGERRQIELAAGAKTHVSYGQNSSGREAVKKYAFDFDLVFDSACSQADVFLEVSALVQSALDGYNVCIFAYGQTGSGKTFTMQGREDSVGYATMQPSSHMGIVGRAIAHIYATIADLRASGWDFAVTLEMVEIYNETLRDLLAPTGSVDKVDLRLDADGRPAIANSCVHKVGDELEAWQLLCKAMSKRSTKATNMNDRSSRSHCVITFRMTGVNAHTGDRRVGVVHLVDLAGSERLNKSGSGNDRELLKEAQAINKSLSSLGNVICALAKKSAHVPFRDSKLTHFLSPSLGGDSKTLMICTLSPLTTHRDESLNSLRFAKTVNSCEITYASVSNRS